MRAAPLPVFWPGAQACFHRIVGNVRTESGTFFVAPNTMIVGLLLPKAFSSANQEPVGFRCSKRFPTMKNRAQCMPGDGATAKRGRGSA